MMCLCMCLMPCDYISGVSYKKIIRVQDLKFVENLG